VVGVLVLVFAGQPAAAGAFLAAVAGVVYALLFSGENLVDREIMGYLQVGAGALGVASKVPQIWTVWKEGGTGQLSAFAVFNYLLGSLSRIFTTLQEVDDKLILYNFAAAFVLNLILAAQMLYYWKAPAPALTEKTQGKKAEKLEGAEVPTTKSAGVSLGPTKGPTRRRRG